MRQPFFLPYEEYYSAAANSSCALHSGTGKRQSRGSVVTPGISSSISAVSTSTQGSLSVYCHRLKRLFLVDSGADVSVYPTKSQGRAQDPSASLTAANGTRINTFGHRNIDLCFPGLRTSHSFILADVASPILGADFFLQQDLVIDIPRRRLFSEKSGVCVRARPATVLADLCGLSCSALTLDGVLDMFPAVVNPAPVYESSRPAKHGLEHTIPTDGPPVFARPRRLFGCLLYTSPSPRDLSTSRMPSSA